MARKGVFKFEFKSTFLQRKFLPTTTTNALNLLHSLYILQQVWGCGDKSSREVQLDIKKWQIKEAERQRTVKLTAADWMDHPDRYLLELGGRQNYNN